MKFGPLVRILCMCWMMLFFFTRGWSQENIPLGTWRVHLSFNKLTSLAVAPDQVYTSNDIGLMILNKADQQISQVSKIDGLSGATITTLAYDAQRSALVIGFQNGLLNILNGNRISIYNGLANSIALSGSRAINNITINGSLAFLSTDFGVVVFDMDKNELRETYRDLGETGEALRIFQSVVHQDSLFLATENGVLAGSLNGTSNLLDFRSWKRYTQGDLNNSIQAVTEFNGQLYAAINAMGIYKLQNGLWVQQSFLQNQSFNSLSSSSANLIVTTAEKVWVTNGSTITEAAAGSLVNPSMAIQETDETIWIADDKSGLVAFANGAVTKVKTNGPSSNSMWRSTYSNDRIIVSKGGYNSSLLPLNKLSNVDQFLNGQWSILPTTLTTDITDQAKTFNATFISTFGSGLERITNENTLIFDHTNSPLVENNSTDGYTLVPSVENSTNGLWVTNYGVPTSLHLLADDLTWETFSFSQPQAQFPVDLLVDQLGAVWMVIDPAKGGGIMVFDKSQSTYLTTTPGKGSLPVATVRSIANDRDGQVWVGTDEGVVYFSNPSGVFNTIDASRPIFENRFLLRDEAVTAIAVDGGNRKWLGTNNGVWLFSPSGEELIYNFTEDNSPLLSNNVISISIDPISGEVFYATAKGLCSFRSTATASTYQFASVKIFPNPVGSEFNGLVAINGLYRDAIVKITDINGRLVWQTQANGGTATWNARQLNGNRVSTGVYLVFATAEDGSERHVGKIAVIE